MDVFDFFKEYTINNNLISINIIEIEEINEEFKQILDKNILNICQRNRNGDIKILKKKIKKILESKTIRIKRGMIAEFFVHLFLNLMNYNQQCLFLNLEENQIKKGFDGVYIKNEEEWFMESKSGTIENQNITHKSKISQAIKDLDEKFSGKIKNDPWLNALHHAAVLESRNTKLLDKLQKLSDDFENEKFYTINNFNIIPSATIFFNGIWNPVSKNKIFEQIHSLMNSIFFKKAHIICISQKNVDLFETYLEMET